LFIMNKPTQLAFFFFEAGHSRERCNRTENSELDKKGEETMKGIGFAVFAGLLLAHASAFSLCHGRIGHAPHAGLRSGTTCALRRKPAISRLQSSAIPGSSRVI